MRRPAAVLAVLCFSLIALPASGQAKSYFLDSYAPQSSKAYSGPVATETLVRGIPYKIAVRGTFSLFASEEIQGSLCGDPEPKPIYPSPKRHNAQVVADAEFVFADIKRRCPSRTTVQAT